MQRKYLEHLMHIDDGLEYNMPLILSTTEGLPVKSRFQLFDLYGRGGFSTNTIKFQYVRSSLLFDLNATVSTSYPGSGTTWTDLSGNGYNGILTNGPTYSSANGGSIGFDGTNDTVDITGVDLQRNFSLEAWVNFAQLSSEGIFGQGTATSNKGLHIRQDNTTTTTFNMYFNDYSVTTSPIITDRWYQYVFTYNHSSPFTKQIYRNGVLLGASGTLSQYAGSGTLRLGATFSSGISEQLSGSISIARGYSKILSAAEVSTNFNGFRHLYGV